MLPLPPTSPKRSPERIVGSSRAIQDVLAQARNVGPLPVNVVLTGPTGCGKENIARYIHQVSKRSPLMIINCGTLRPELAGAELFGHLRGSFTGAESSRRGLLEAAHGGTVFLDEVGELPLPVQTSLLRVIQQGTVRPIGGTRERHLDLRFVCATHRDLASMVRKGAFREDLYWRLARCELEVPALKERGSDVIEIAEYILATDPLFSDKSHRLDRSVHRVLLSHSWPGNVRELQRVLTRVVIRGSGPLITGEEVRRAIEGEPPALHGTSGSRERILHLLHHFGVQTASVLSQQLEVGRATFQRWIDPLLESGEVRRLGDGRATEYELGGSGVAEAGGASRRTTAPGPAVRCEPVEITVEGLMEPLGNATEELPDAALPRRPSSESSRRRMVG